MKHLFKSLLVAAAIAGPFVAHVNAQNPGMVADVPFAFVANHKIMPAGTYKVQELKPGSPIFIFTDAQRKSVATQFGVNQDGKPEQPSLTFACYGNQRVLAKVTPPGASIAFGLSKGAIERQLTHKLGMASMVSVNLRYPSR